MCVKLCSTYCHTESETPATSYRVTVFMSMEDRHFKIKSGGWWEVILVDSVVVASVREPLRKYVPHEHAVELGGRVGQASLSWIMDGGERGEVWIRTHGKSAAHIQTHTQRQWCEAKRVVRRLWVSGAVRLCLVLVRMSSGITAGEGRTRNLSDNLPLSLSPILRINETEMWWVRIFSVVYHNHSAILSFYLLDLFSNQSPQHRSFETLWPQK